MPFSSLPVTGSSDFLVKIAVDAMGGDLGPRVNVAGALIALAEHPALDILLVGDRPSLESALACHALAADYAHRLQILHAPSAIAMDARPSSVLRGKADSSMHIALQQVAEGKAMACVSAGNTGALMVLGRQLLGMPPGIQRPAISTAIPTRQGRCYMLDLGANVDCEAEQLLQFALMGSAMVELVDGLKRPRVGLLNVGVEDVKGNLQVRRAAALIAACTDLNYIGYLEGDQIFQDQADVVVCDGFVGNVALKTSEGLARLLSSRIRDLFAESWYARLVSLMARPLLKRLRAQMDPVRYNGGSLLGLQGTVIKSHGSADARGMAYAIARALREAEHGLAEGLYAHMTARMAKAATGHA